MTDLRIDLSGRVSVRCGEATVDEATFGGRQVRSAFAYLVLSGGRPVSRDELADALWPAGLPASWEGALRVVVTKLRRVLERAGIDASEAVRNPGGAYELRLPEGCMVDVVEAARTIGDADGGGRETQTDGLRTAVEILANPFLPGESAPWVDAERERLQRQLVRGRECLAEALLLQGDSQAAVREAEAALALEPFRESLYQILMRAHASVGNRAEALRVYEQWRALIGAELGVDPSPETEQLHRDLLRDTPAGRTTVATPARPAAPPSRGLAAFVFTDVVASTERLERLGDAAASEERRAHFALLREAVASTGGSEVKTLGDGLMAVFSTTTDALECATRIQARVARRNRRSEGDPLLVRIGVAAGEATKDGDDWFGAPVVQASRLCDVAQPAQTLCTDLVRTLAGSARLEPVGSVELRGLSEPVGVWRVPWADADPSPIPLPSALAPGDDLPFAGRDEELETLRGAWKLVDADGALAAVLVSGEPGVGKTQLVTEAARSFHHDGGTVLLGRCDEHLQRPLAPFAEAVSFLVSHLSDAELAAHADEHGGELVRLAPSLADRVPAVASPREAEGETGRGKFFDAVAALLAAASRQGRLVLFLDDLHWADNSTLLLLRHLVRSGVDSSVLLLGTYRDTDFDEAHPLARTLAELRRERRTARIALRGLDEGGVAHLVARAVGGTSEEYASLGRSLRDETDGNPFFVGELVRYMSESGTIAPDARLRPAGAHAVVPQGVREVVSHRLTTLPDDVSEALRVGAVLGAEFDVTTLARMLDRDEEEVLESMEVATARALLKEAGDDVDRYAFAHAIVRDTLYDALSKPRRRRLHRRAAQILDASSDCPRVTVAHHFCEGATADVISDVVRSALEAAREANERIAFEDASDTLLRAVSVIKRVDPDNDRALAELFVELSHEGGLLEDMDREMGYGLDAANAARKAGWLDGFMKGAVSYAGWSSPDNAARVVPYLQDAIEFVGDHELYRHRLRAMILFQHSWKGPEVLEPARQMLADARRVGEPLDLWRTASVLGNAVNAWAPECVDEQLDAADVMFGCLASGLRTSGGSPMAPHMRGAARLRMGDLAGFDEDSAIIRGMSEDEGLLKAEHLLYVHCVTRGLLTGDVAVAEAVIPRQRAIGEQRPAIYGRTAEATEYYVNAYRGRWDELLATHERLDIETRNPVPVALALAGLGRLDEARAEMVRAKAGLAARPTARNVYFAADATTASGLTGYTDIVDDLEAILHPSAGLLITGGAPSPGSCDRFLGILALLRERWDEAERLFASAEALESSIGAAPHVATTRYWLARSLIARDRARATRILDSVVRACGEIGMDGLAAEARRLAT